MALRASHNLRRWSCNHLGCTKLTRFRSYHSTTHAKSTSPFTEAEARILSSSVPYIPTHGFTVQTLGLGAREAGFLDASTNLFPRGPWSLVHWQLWTHRTALSEMLVTMPENENTNTELTIDEKVRILTWERLLCNQAVINKWQEAIAIMALPQNVVSSLKELNSLSDEICYLAGDLSMDTSWYTKRASLSTIYAATEIFMTTDESAGFRDTRAFMERAFEDAQRIGRAVGDLSHWASFTFGSVVNVARSKGMRI